MFQTTRKYSPIGEYVRLLVLQRLARGPAPVDELNKIVCETVNAVTRKIGLKYDCSVWTELLKYEIEIKNDMVYLTRIGEVVYRNIDEVVDYLRKWKLL